MSCRGDGGGGGGGVRSGCRGDADRDYDIGGCRRPGMGQPQSDLEAGTGQAFRERERLPSE